MASHALEYRNSSELKSAKSAPAVPSPLVRRIDASRLPGRLARTLKCLVIASQQGPDLWASTFAVSIEGSVSYRTAQRHIDELERLRVLKKKHEANSFVGRSIRRTATYVLHSEAEKQLAPRQTFGEWKKCNRRQAPARFRPRPDSQPPEDSGKTNSPAPEPVPVQEAKPQPVSIGSRSSHHREIRRLTKRQGEELVKEIASRMRGQTYSVGFDKLAIKLSPGDPTYKAPMSQENALVAACMYLSIQYEEAKEHLKLCCWKFDGEEGKQ